MNGRNASTRSEGMCRGTVSLKLLRAERQAGKPLAVIDPDEERPLFAHLKLRAAPIPLDALDNSATAKALGCVAVLPASRAATC